VNIVDRKSYPIDFKAINSYQLFVTTGQANKSIVSPIVEFL
jgi:hypothetical protein